MEKEREMKFATHLGRLSSTRRVGFTLIEVMIVVAVIGLLSVIAYPSYTQYVIRANRSAAQQFMLSIASRQEQYVLDNRAYASTIAALGLTAPAETTTRYTFSVALVAGPPPGYTITATSIGPQVSDGNLTLDNLGTKTPADKWKK